MEAAYRIVAWDPPSGWAYVAGPDGLLLLSPPYRDRAREVTPEIVSRALGEEGFTPSDEPFDSLALVPPFLDEAAAAFGPPSERETVAEVFDSAWTLLAPEDHLEVLRQLQPQLKDLPYPERTVFLRRLLQRPAIAANPATTELVAGWLSDVGKGPASLDEEYLQILIAERHILVGVN